ncbi:adenylate/guanylate cyclase domain-containing protein [Mesorhizobium sp. M0488]|uniref:adenylate/guanylate cyclase domain-containing protein n=1 Tax=unclassified Mesorhizobium TaxID=325217 RepID=UPI00333918E9
MSETRKLAAILVADVVGYSRLAASDEDRTLARLRALRSDLINPTIAVHRGRVVKLTGDGTLVEFRSVVDAVRCAIEMQNGMVERNAGLPPGRRIEFRVGIHLCDIVEESDGDLMGDGVNIAARLESVAEPNGICLSAAAYEHVRDKIKEEFVDLGEKELKNIARPVRTYGLRLRDTVPKSEPAASAESSENWALPDTPSIAVLPFQNMGGDPEQEYFADGLAEDIITRLSRLRWLFVSARNSLFTYKGKAVDVKQVGRELGVRYVLDGSVRRSGHRLRIGAQVSDTSTGVQVWAERYDVELSEFFALQDQIAESVIAAIEPRLYTAEQQRFQRSSPNSLDAWGFVMKAMPYVWTWSSATEIEIAQGFLKQATDLDPNYPRANSLLAWAHAARVLSGWANAVDILPTSRALAQRAIQRDPEDPWTHLAAGFVHMVSRGFDSAVRELNEAIELNPSFAFAHSILGSTYGYGGMPADGLNHLEIAGRLSPRDYTYAANFSILGLCHFMAGRYADAVQCECRAVELRPHFGSAWRTYATAAGMAGELDIAVHALSEAKRLQPSLSLQWVEKFHPIVHDKHRALYVEGLRIAGLR